jgi:DNA-binding transcriptional regulator LsrR (DeoR family)
MEKAANTKIKILGVGGLFETSQIVKSKIFSAKSIEKLKKAGALGDVAGNFFDKMVNLIKLKKQKNI